MYAPPAGAEESPEGQAGEGQEAEGGIKEIERIYLT